MAEYTNVEKPFLGKFSHDFLTEYPYILRTLSAKLIIVGQSQEV